jgi:hypothetical protein
MIEAEQIMKRCQAGTRNYEEANNLHAACYGMIGKLLAQLEQWQDQTVVEIHEAILEEREVCALICDDHHHIWRFGEGEYSASGPKDCAAAIRARTGEQA